MSDATPAVAHALCAPVPCSPNTAAVLDVAVACAHPSPVGSEHVLWALFNVEGYRPRIIGWIGRKTVEVYESERASDADSIFQWFRTRVLATLAEKGFVAGDGGGAGGGAGGAGGGAGGAGGGAGGAGGGGGNNPTLTSSMQRILDVTRGLSNGSVRDGDTIYQGGLVATEFIVAAILVEGTNVAADILSRCSRGLVNSWNLLEAIHVDPATLHPPRAAGPVSFEAQSVNGGAGGGPTYACTAWEPADSLPDIGDGSWCAAPVPYANWLVPGRFMIGETPGGDGYSPRPESGSGRNSMQTELQQLCRACRIVQ